MVLKQAADFVVSDFQIKGICIKIIIITTSHDYLYKNDSKLMIIILGGYYIDLGHKWPF